ATQGRVRPRRANHRPAPVRGDSRPAGRFQAARRPRRPRGSGPDLRAADMRRAVAASIISMIAVASAGGQGVGVAVRPGSLGLAHARPVATNLDPVVLTYIATVQHDTSSRPLGERTVQLTRTMYAGSQAWEIVETHGAG